MTEHIDVEGPITEAAIMAEVICQWMATSLGFENRVPPKLTEDDCSRIYWAITTLAAKTRADEAYLERTKREMP